MAFFEKLNLYSKEERYFLKYEAMNFKTDVGVRDLLPSQSFDCLGGEARGGSSS